MMNQAVLCLLAGSLTALTLAAAGDAPAKPNIVLFLADDLGYGDMGEKNDLLASRSDEVARLKRLLASWEKEVQPRR